jgi:hypothetical protein
MNSISKAQENQVGLKWNATHQLLVYADENLLGDNLDTIEEKALIDTSKEVKANTQKIKYILMYYHVTSMQGKITT